MKRSIGIKILTFSTAMIAGVGVFSALHGLPFLNNNKSQTTATSLTLSRNSHRDWNRLEQEAWQQAQQALEQAQQQAQQLTQHPSQAQSQQTAGDITLPANTSGSGNWGGYVVTPTADAKPYTSVSGKWTVPNVTSDQSDAIGAQWIGLGGVNSSDLLQMGTTEEIQNGQVVANVFWEKLPDAAQDVMTVPIGSTIDASIYQADATTWDIKCTVTTPNGQTQTKTIPVTLGRAYGQGIGTSAEWISEDPSNMNDQLYPLANMGTVRYKSALVDGQPINASDNNIEPVALVNGSGDVLIAPSELGSDGQSFSTATLSTDTGTTGYGQGRGYGNRRGQNQYGFGASDRPNWGQGYQDHRGGHGSRW